MALRDSNQLGNTIQDGNGDAEAQALGGLPWDGFNAILHSPDTIEKIIVGLGGVGTGLVDYVSDGAYNDFMTTRCRFRRGRQLGCVSWNLSN